MGELGEPAVPLEQALLSTHGFGAQTQSCSCLTQLENLTGTAENATTTGLTHRGTQEGKHCGEEGEQQETRGLLICFRTTRACCLYIA